MRNKNRQTRTVEFRGASVRDNTISGAAAVIGNLDSYKTVIFPGFFGQPCIDDFLSRGFMANSHDWEKVIGMPTKASVNGRELQAEAEFHSDPHSQVVRTRCMERAQHGLSVGLSIGFGIGEQKEFRSGQALLDFAKQRGCDMSLFDEPGIAAHTGKCTALLSCSRLYEFSPVAVPANDEATATDVRGEVVTRGQYLGEDIEQTLTISALSRLSDMLFYRCFNSAIFGTCEYDWAADTYEYVKPTLEESLAMVAGGCDEFKAMALKVVEAILSGVDGAEAPQDAMTSLKAYFGNPETRQFEDGARAARSFEAEVETALAAVQGCIERSKAIQAIRATKGRSISAERIEQLKSLRAELDTMLASVPVSTATATRILQLKSASLRLLAVAG